MDNTTQKISVSLPRYLITYTETYRRAHGLTSRSEVIALAVKTLRDTELAHGYRALAEEYQQRPDPLLDSGLSEGLDPSSEETW